uniref:Estrogen receptor n=1 Tax=Perinereis aibuhitensis TaxID=126650 RepID=A0A1L2A6R0_PERAI|nr:estrogen receptor [Perinereis aibuhitensis]
MSMSHSEPRNLGNLPTTDMAEELVQSTSNASFGQDHETQESYGSPTNGATPSTETSHSPVDQDGQETRKKCQICNDFASGFHYGVWSCEGCKAFFKRSLQGPVDYMCPATNNCTIDKHRRKSCQACRFRKCLDVGMMKRRERRSKKSRSHGSDEEKISVKKMKKPLSPPEVHDLRNNDLDTQRTRHAPVVELNESSESNATLQASSEEISSPSMHTTTQTSPFILIPSPSSSTGSNSHTLDPSAINSDPGPPLDQPHPLVVQLEQNDLPTKMLGQALTESETEYSLLHKLISLADLELVDIVNWAKAIPGFSELLLHDRIALLESCWMELLCVGAAWRSRLNSTFQINFAEDLHLNEELASKAKLSSIVGEIWQISRQFMYFELSHHEFLLLRVILLLNSESVRLTSVEAMYDLRGRCLDALHFECGRTLGKISESSCVRMAQILCILPFARQVSLKSITHLFNLHNQHTVPVGELVAEMLVAQKEQIVSVATSSSLIK